MLRASSISIILAVLLAPYFASRWQSDARQVRVFSNDAPARPETITSLKILTYNIAHGRGPTGGNWDGPVAADRERIDQIARLIRRHNLDVVVLN